MAPLSAKPQGAGPSVLPLKHNWAQITWHSHLKTDYPKKAGVGWTRTILAVKWGAYTGSLGKSVSTPRPHAVPSELLLVYYLILGPETCCKRLSFSLGRKGNGMLAFLFALEARKHGYICTLTEKNPWIPGSNFTSLRMVLIWKVKKLQIIWWKTQYASIRTLFVNLTARWKHSTIEDSRLQLH